MKNIFIALCLTLSFIGCKTAPINQKENKKRIGLWIEEYSIDSTKYKSVGKYKNGDPAKKWLYYTNNRISKKEVYRKNKCITTFYYANGKVQSKGKTKLVVTGTQMHWFYYDNWKYFDENENLISTKKYENGEFISEIKTEQLTRTELKK
jgi:antitoxin component YwqK of YwqJK toxin-antitoxin module